MSEERLLVAPCTHCREKEGQLCLKDQPHLFFCTYVCAYSHLNGMVDHEPDSVPQWFIWLLKQRYTAFVALHRRRRNRRLEQALPTSSLRLVTYNVHYFVDEYDAADNSSRIARELLSLDADYILLHEVIMDVSTINDKVRIDGSHFFSLMQLKHYTMSCFIPITPSVDNGRYGTCLLTHERHLHQKKGVEGSTPLPFFCEPVFFPASTDNMQIAGLYKGHVDRRGYLYYRFQPGGTRYHMFGTHLQPVRVVDRLTQTQAMLDHWKSLPDEYRDDVAIILGDFNSISRQQYRYQPIVLNNAHLPDDGAVVHLLQQNGFHDLFEDDPPRMTVWYNLRVDFIFANRYLYDLGHIFAYYSDASDHLPLVLTIN